MPAATILYLVRHGRTLGAEGRCVGQHDLEMDPAAGEALDRLAGSFERPPLRLVCSDLLRARSTMERLSAAWRIRPVPEPRLREMNFGMWDGRSWAEVERSDGDRLQAWMSDWSTMAAPGGESFADVAKRTGEWLQEVSTAGGDLLAVAHAGSIRALLCGIMEWPLDRAFRLQVDHGRVSAVRLGREPTLLFLNADRVPAG